MIIKDVVWLNHIIEKLDYKHGVMQQEVEEALYNKPKIRFAGSGEQEGEDVYTALGRSNEGRYLVVIFVYKRDQTALVISARDMDGKERKLYGRK